MADRLQRALRELAAALDEAAEEDRWEVVRVLEEVAPALRGETRQNEDTQLAQSVSAPVGGAGAEGVSQDLLASPPRTQDQPPVLKPEIGGFSLASSSTSSLACGSTVAYHQDLRHYVVVECPGKPALLGYVCGPAASTWRRLEAQLPSGKLSTSRARLRRVVNKEEAAQVWAVAHPGTEMPMVCL